MDANQCEQSSASFERCALYLRYSTNMQRPASLEDQERNCRDFAKSQGWAILDEHVYRDAALSGTRLAGRKGLEAMEAAAQRRPRPFDYLIVDDTSRLSRDLVDVLQLTKNLKADGVNIHFVMQNLDSKDEATFTLALPIYGLIDEQQVARLRKKVRSGLEGRFLNGYNAGSVAYGYRSIAVQSANSRAIGRARTEGSKLVIVEEEAVVIRRIYTWYADGKSIFSIVRMLNVEGISWPHAKHGKWGPDAVKRILHNEKYRGVNRFGMTTQKKHPRTGQVIKEYKPEAEQLRLENESLRIVSDELWNRVAERLRQLNEKQNARKQGGYNRAQNNSYLYSGLLVCGICGRHMRIGGRQGRGVYECPNHRTRGGCTNSFRIREEVASKQITDALANQLLLPETMSYLAISVYRELKEVLDQRKNSLTPDSVKSLEAAKAECERKIANIVEAIEDTGLERLRHRLEALEFERGRIAADLRTARAARSTAITEDNIQALLSMNVENLLAVLQSNKDMARMVLLRHMKFLRLFPDEVDGRPVFNVLGEMDLFTAPDDTPDTSNGGVLLGVSGTLNDQQHTVDSVYRFYITIEAKTQDECPLLEPFCRLLTAHSELSLKPYTPTEWSKHLRPYIPGERKMPGYGAIARVFWSYRDQLAEKLIILKTANPENSLGHRYQISLRSSTDSARQLEAIAA